MTSVVAAVNAQLPANSIAPNFTATDINGNTHDLYEILNSNKPVIMDVSATWCGPCWNYHNTHALRDLYEEFGPDGTDELMVIFIEGDPSTSLECLYGNSAVCPTTQGNWTADTPYPIIDSGAIADAYNIGYFPTVYMICTGRLVSEVGQLSKAQLKAKADACPEVNIPGTALTVISMDSDYPYDKICGTATVSPSLLIVNSGTDTIKSVQYELKVNGQVVPSTPYTTPIDPASPDVLTLSPVTLSGASIVKVTITALNGTALATPIVRQKTFSVAKKVTTKSLTLELKTDNYGEETYWELVDLDGNVYASGGNTAVGPNGGGSGGANNTASAYADNATIVETFEVPENGCYVLHMVDAYGDGMCYGTVVGGYKLYETATPTNILANGTCDFADARGLFGADGIVGVNNLVEEGSMRVFPNPATDMINVNFSMKSAADVQITISNTLGQLVRDLGTTAYGTGSNAKSINVADLTTGIYQLSLRTNEGTVTRTFSVN
jgi:hypothetical protein